MPLIEDRDALVEVLEFTEKLFDLLIPKLKQGDKQLFEEAWNETRPTLQQQVTWLKTITSEENPIWMAIKRVGLTSKNLAMKLHYLAIAASGGWRTKLFDLLNKFLGSLAGGLPGIEPIKELKEWLESVVENDTGMDPAIATLYSQQHYRHFRKKP